MLQTVTQTDGLQGTDGSLAALAGIVLVVIHQWQFHILDGRGLGQQVVVLEHEAYLLVAQMGTLGLRHGAHGILNETPLRAFTVSEPTWK